ncbi:MAG: TonB-dependent receptor, partial [Pseudomonadota bacterium]
HDELDYDGQFFADDASVLAGNPLQRSNTVPGLEVERTNFLLDVSYQTDFGRIISTTGYLESNLAGVEDFDLGPDPNQILSRDNFEDTFSQEFRFESNEFDVGTGTLTFNLGLNYSETSAETQSDFEALIDFSGLGPGASNTIFTRDVENRSIFGDVRWQATPQLEIAVGARYSVDDVRVRTQALRTGSLAGFGSPTFVRDADFDAFLPSISVLYDWNDSFSTFASYAKGYKPGGFTAQSGALGQFEEEFADSYELGLRYVGFDDRLRLRATLFYVDYTDIQVPIRQDPANGFFGGVENAAGAESQGFELSFSTDPLPGLTIEGAFGYTDATFTNYAGSSFGDLTGFSLPNAPDRTYSLIVDYEFQNKFRGLTPFVRGEFNGTSGFRPEAINFNEVGDYNLVNLRTGFRGENVDLTLFVENLFDETYAVDGFSTFLSPGAPRTYGIVASYRF